MRGHLCEEPKDVCKIILRVGEIREDVEGETGGFRAPPPSLVLGVGKLWPTSQIHSDACFGEMVFYILKDF